MLREKIQDENLPSDSLDVKKVDLIRPYTTTLTMKDRYKINQIDRRDAMNESTSILRKTVPGVGLYTDKATVMQITATYIKFIRKKFGSEHDAEFLKEIHV